MTALLARIHDSFEPHLPTVLFVDDSTDDTPLTIERAARDSALPVRLLHRPAGERDGGLAGAVVAGLHQVSDGIVVVMDGDLQHPPEVAHTLVQLVDDRSVDLAVASRYLAGGAAGGLASWRRHGVSLASTALARALFPRRVGAHCTDPMTGFFCLRRSAIRLDVLRPRGFKILLEILATHDIRVTETPFIFDDRYAGVSKASLRNGLAFTVQLAQLRLRRTPRTSSPAPISSPGHAHV